MKKRDIILDFTSLLDVTLIVIFFFVLFSHLDSQENKKRTEAKIHDLEVAIQNANERETNAETLVKQLENEISIVKEYSDRQALNVSEIIKFNRNENIKIILDMNANDWSLRVIKNDNVISVINRNDDTGTELKKAISYAGYDINKTIFCELIFDGSLPSTASAYHKIKAGIEDVCTNYKYFYLSETDLSIGGR